MISRVTRVSVSVPLLCSLPPSLARSQALSLSLYLSLSISLYRSLSIALSLSLSLSPSLSLSLCVSFPLAFRTNCSALRMVVIFVAVLVGPA